MHGNQMVTNAVPALSASDKVFSEMETLYETLDRLEAKLISKFDNMYVQPADGLDKATPENTISPYSQTFSNLFLRIRTCTSRANRMIDYVNNCES